MNGGSAGGGAAGAAAAQYNSRIKRWVAEEDGKEYFFIHYPNEAEPLRQQPILRIKADDMVLWEASIVRLGRRALLGYALLFIGVVAIVYCFEQLHLQINILARLGVLITAI